MRPGPGCLAAAVLILASAAGAAAQTPDPGAQPTPAPGAQPTPATPEARPAVTEADAYRAWYEAQADLPKAVELARAYLQRFASGRYADYLRQWLTATRGRLFNEAMAAGRLTDMERLAREALAEKPDDVDFAVLVAYAARRQLTASPPDYTHAAAAAEFSQRAITLLEAGKLPTVYDRATWSRDRTLAWLHETLAILDAREDRTDAALAHYREATRLDPSGPAGFLGCGSLHQRKYLEAVRRFQAFPEDDRREPARKPEVKAALDQVDREADLVIECWVSFLALTPTRPEWADTRQSVRKVLGELYAYRHPDTPGGLDRLIESAAAKAPRP